ncbi:LamG domain-containing protein [Allorhizocola rhizosphaerae]|uniref:LamG domain-containing protein n=1 Tax=Allorhizocola rhizosphaerae TaxID=1872709 RepID=UPI000E3DE52D|nr:LamG domain-containing protein [Allorhizocola rhizosphaerae]
MAAAADDSETRVLAAIEPDADEFVPAPGGARRLLIPAIVAGVVLAGGGGAWILSGQPGGPRLFQPPGTSSHTTGNSVIEGFGEASAEPSPSASPRVSPSPSTTAQTSPAPPSPSPAPQAGPPAPLAHYRFDESSGTSSADASGGGRTATIAGGAGFVSGRLDNAIDLNGSSQYVALPSGILSGATDFTVAAWVRLDSNSAWSRVFDFGSSASVNMFLTARSDAGTARFAITTGGYSREQRINAPAPLPTGTWTHVAVTLRDGVGILYVNRAEVGRTTGMTLSPASLGSTSRNWIGRSQYSVDPYLNGLVDDVRIYTRALPASEIAALP